MSLTPMMQQYREAKARYPGMLLFFRNGDFYELFEEDAELGARLLGIALTRRDKDIPMAGVPYHAVDKYLQKLLQAGHRVAICEQLEDASQAKGLIRREVVRVVTPGTVTEEGLLDPRRANHLLAFVPRGSQVGLAWVELSTGQFQALDLPTSRFADELARLAPAEILCAERELASWGERLRAAVPTAVVTPRPDWNFETQAAHAALHRHFRVSTLAGFGFHDQQLCLSAAGALLLYVQETLRANLNHLGRLRPHRPEQFLLIDEVTRRSLELTRTLREGTRDGSLLATIDRTLTPMGARLLADWLLAPLAERSGIEARQEAVAELLASGPLRQTVRQLLLRVADLPRLTARASTGRASPRDLAAIGRTLALVPALKSALASCRCPLLRDLDSRLDPCPDLRETLENALVDTPPLSPREGGLIRDGYHAELDELRRIARGGKEWIARFQAQEITRTGIPSLKVGFNKVFGYYIEVTHAQASKVPPDYQRKQTLKNAERYITPELKEYEEKVLMAEERSCALEYELFVALREQAAAAAPQLLQTAEALAQLDVLAGLAELADSRHYCRPELCTEPILEIRDGRHPVLDQTLPAGTFVPNDVSLGPEQGFFWLVTGPNMAGKSIFIRQVALLTILAQMGSFVPARAMRLGLVDRLFSRVGASDEVGRGHSTFMVEMTEAANILNNATPRSLVILDEIGRGTSTYDGVSLAWAITEYLHNRIGCRTLFATHYHELAQLAESLPGLRNYNVLVREVQDDIVFLHKIAPGSSDKSYGIHVARLAGLPPEVLERAREVLGELETHQVTSRRRPTPPRRSRPAPPEGGLFAGLEAEASGEQSPQNG